MIRAPRKAPHLTQWRPTRFEFVFEGIKVVVDFVPSMRGWAWQVITARELGCCADSDRYYSTATRAAVASWRHLQEAVRDLRQHQRERCVALRERNRQLATRRKQYRRRKNRARRRSR